VGNGLGLINVIKNWNLLALPQLLQQWFPVESSDMLLDFTQDVKKLNWSR